MTYSAAAIPSPINTVTANDYYHDSLAPARPQLVRKSRSTTFINTSANPTPTTATHPSFEDAEEIRSSLVAFDTSNPLATPPMLTPKLQQDPSYTNYTKRRSHSFSSLSTDASNTTILTSSQNHDSIGSTIFTPTGSDFSINAADDDNELTAFSMRPASLTNNPFRNSTGSSSSAKRTSTENPILPQTTSTPTADTANIPEITTTTTTTTTTTPTTTSIPLEKSDTTVQSSEKESLFLSSIYPHPPHSREPSSTPDLASNFLDHARVAPNNNSCQTLSQFPPSSRRPSNVNNVFSGSINTHSFSSLASFSSENSFKSYDSNQSHISVKKRVERKLSIIPVKVPPNELNYPANDVSDANNQKRIRTKYNLIRELLSTEQTFAQDLEAILEVYYNQAKSYPYKHFLYNGDVEVLFGTVEQILNASKDFVNNLKNFIPTYILHECNLSPSSNVELKDLESNVGILLLEYLPTMELAFKIYCTQNEYQMNTLYRIQALASPTIDEWFAECKERSKGMTNAWTLDALLIKPVQRLLKYPLLYKSMLQTTPEYHPDYESIKCAYEEVAKCATRINLEANTSKSTIARPSSRTSMGSTVSGSSTPAPPNSNANAHTSFIPAPLVDENTLLERLKVDMHADRCLSELIEKFDARHLQFKKLISSIRGNTAFTQLHFDNARVLANSWYAFSCDQSEEVVVDSKYSKYKEFSEQFCSGASPLAHVITSNMLSGNTNQNSALSRQQTSSSPSSSTSSLTPNNNNNNNSNGSNPSISTTTSRTEAPQVPQSPVPPALAPAGLPVTPTTPVSKKPVSPVSTARYRERVEKTVVAPLQQVLNICFTITETISMRNSLHTEFKRYIFTKNLEEDSKKSFFSNKSLAPTHTNSSISSTGSGSNSPSLDLSQAKSLMMKRTSNRLGQGNNTLSGIFHTGSFDFGDDSDSHSISGFSINSTHNSSSSQASKLTMREITSKKADKFLLLHNSLKNDLPQFLKSSLEILEPCLQQLLNIQVEWLKSVVQTGDAEVYKFVPDRVPKNKDDFIIMNYLASCQAERKSFVAVSKLRIIQKDPEDSIGQQKKLSSSSSSIRSVKMSKRRSKSKPSLYESDLNDSSAPPPVPPVPPVPQNLPTTSVVPTTPSSEKQEGALIGSSDSNTPTSAAPSRRQSTSSIIKGAPSDAPELPTDDVTMHSFRSSQESPKFRYSDSLEMGPLDDPTETSFGSDTARSHRRAISDADSMDANSIHSFNRQTTSEDNDEKEDDDNNAMSPLSSPTETTQPLFPGDDDVTSVQQPFNGSGGLSTISESPSSPSSSSVSSSPRKPRKSMTFSHKEDGHNHHQQHSRAASSSSTSSSSFSVTRPKSMTGLDMLQAQMMMMSMHSGGNSNGNINTSILNRKAPPPPPLPDLSPTMSTISTFSSHSTGTTQTNISSPPSSNRSSLKQEAVPVMSATAGKTENTVSSSQQQSHFKSMYKKRFKKHGIDASNVYLASSASSISSNDSNATISTYAPSDATATQNASSTSLNTTPSISSKPHATNPPPPSTSSSSHSHSLTRGRSRKFGSASTSSGPAQTHHHISAPQNVTVRKCTNINEALKELEYQNLQFQQQLQQQQIQQLQQQSGNNSTTTASSSSSSTHPLAQVAPQQVAPSNNQSSITRRFSISSITSLTSVGSSASTSRRLSAISMRSAGGTGDSASVHSSNSSSSLSSSSNSSSVPQSPQQPQMSPPPIPQLPQQQQQQQQQQHSKNKFRSTLMALKTGLKSSSSGNSSLPSPNTSPNSPGMYNRRSMM